MSDIDVILMPFLVPITMLIVSFIIAIINIEFGTYKEMEDFIKKIRKNKREKILYEIYREMLPSLKKMVEN